MNVLTNLVKRNLILNKRRTIVTIISIILSCALIGGVATLVGSFQRFMQDVEIEDSGNYHAVFRDVPSDKIKYIKNNAYIDISMESAILGYSHFEGGKNEYKPYLYVMAVDKNFIDNMNMRLVEGKYPTNSKELIINETIASDGGVEYNIGDKITLNVGIRQYDGEELGQKNPYNDDNNETINNAKSQEYTIVGILARPSFEPYNAPGYTVITHLDNELRSTVSKYDVNVITKDPKNIYDKMEEIAFENDFHKKNGQYQIDYHNALLRWYGVTDNDNANQMLYNIEAILIAVIMIASIIVIYNSFNISITERKKQFGMLSSIGTTSKQIRNMVLKEGLFLSAIAIPLGIISSIIGIGVTLHIINNLGIFDSFNNTRLILTVSPLSIIITIFFGGLTILISSLIPAIKASRTSPIDAIRLADDIKIKGKKIKTSKLTRRLFGIEGELAAKNMKRNRKKYRSTIISLFVSIILFMTVNSFAEYSFRSSLKLYNDYNYNVNVAASKDILNYISKFDDIKDYSITNSSYMSLYLDEEQLNDIVVDDLKDGGYDPEKDKYVVSVKLSALNDESFEKYAKEIGVNLKDYKDITNPKLIMINKSNFYSMKSDKFYQVTLTNIKQNDKISLSSDDINNDFTVGKIVSTYPIGFNNADNAYQTIQAFITYDVYDSLNEELKMENSTMFIDSSNPNKLTSAIESYSKQVDVNINVNNIDEAVQMLKNIVLAISIFLYGFIVLVSLITITNVINTVTTSIYLRRREFAMLKAVGMTNKSFNKMIKFESAFYGLKSLIYGLPLGVLIDYFMYNNVNSVFVYDYEIPYKAIFICIAFVFVIISITMAYSVRKIRNDNIIDVIKQENL